MYWARQFRLLLRRSIHVVMVAGDNERPARHVAAQGGAMTLYFVLIVLAIALLINDLMTRNPERHETMDYTHNRFMKGADIDAVDARTRAALAERGFGVLTEIDVKATLKAKIGEEIDDYRILGACNPGMAHKAIQIEPRVGAMLPCNVILRAVEGGVEISAVDPVASMSAIGNAELIDIAAQVRDMLNEAVDAA